MSGWQEIALGELCDAGGGEIRTGPFGSQLHEADYSEIGTPVVMPKDIATGRADDATIARVSDEHVERLSQHKLAVGDIVYGRRGDIGRKALVTEREAGWLCGTGCLRVTVGNKADPRFLFYRLGHPDTVANIRNRAVGATMPNLNTTILRETPLTIPPLSIQRRIASILGAYDDLIEVNRRRIAVLEEMARGLFEEWFVRFRFPGHETVPIIDTPDGPLPEGWRIVKVGAVLQKFRRPVKIKKQEYEHGGIIPCIDQGADYIGGYTNNTDALITAPLPLCVFGDHTRVLKFITFPFASGADGTQLLYPIDDLTPEFLYFSLLNIDLTNQHYARHFKFLKEQEIWLPVRELVERFTMIAGAQMQLVENIRSQNQKLAAARDLLLPRLISGQLSVAEAEQQLVEVA